MTTQILERPTVEMESTLQRETLESLQDLLQANIDGAKGFDTVADAMHNAFAEVRFAERADERREHASELSRLLLQNGESPKNDGSWLAAFHRNWIVIRATLSGGDTAPMLAEIERGEQYLADRYEEALTDCPAPAVADVLHAQLAKVREMIGLIQAERAKLDA